MLELDKGIFLGEGTQVHFGAQVVHRQQVLLPEVIELAEHQTTGCLTGRVAAFGGVHFGIFGINFDAEGLEDLCRGVDRDGFGVLVVA